MSEVRRPNLGPSFAGDQVRVSVHLAVDPSAAFRAFTEDVDLWWRRGVEYRVSGRRPGVLYFEPRNGGRLLESFETPNGTRVLEMGRITTWEPPARLAFEWRGANFAPDESTEVEVLFEPSRSGTLLTLTHRGWSRIRSDHPVRHGLDVAPFVRMIGLWWGDLLTSLREHVVRS